MIRELADDGALNPKAIQDLVCKKFPGEAVSLRTVQRKVRESRPRDGAEIWALASDQGDDARLILGCLASLVRTTGNPNRRITVRTAEWIVAVARAAPDLPSWSTYRLARWYEGRTSTNDSTEDLDLYLAMSPWRSLQAHEAYEGLQASDEIDSSRTFSTDDLFEWAVVKQWVDARAHLELAREKGLRSRQRKMRRRLARLPVPGYKIAVLRALIDEQKRSVEAPPGSGSMLEKPEPDRPELRPDSSAGQGEGVPSR